MHVIRQIENELATRQLPDVRVGDTVEVHYLIREGDKERVQLFIGTVIAMNGRGIAKSITVRRIVQGEGVERVFPLHNPRVKDVVTTRRGDVRRSKLYYLRDRVGKSTRVKELLSSKSDEGAAAEAKAAPQPDQTVEV
jgi:large subunit ribosomal protein L19